MEIPGQFAGVVICVSHQFPRLSASMLIIQDPKLFSYKIKHFLKCKKVLKKTMSVKGGSHKISTVFTTAV
jgi:hypothetical protein